MVKRNPPWLLEQAYLFIFATKLRQRDLGGGKRFEAGLKSGHEHGCGNTFAGDIGHGEYHAIFFVGFAGTGKHIVVVAGDGVGRARGIGDRDSGNLRRSAGQQPGLNFARNLQIALHHDAVGNLQHQSRRSRSAAPEMEVEFDRRGFRVQRRDS